MCCAGILDGVWGGAGAARIERERDFIVLRVVSASGIYLVKAFGRILIGVRWSCHEVWIFFDYCFSLPKYSSRMYS